MSESYDRSYYEIALTNGQVLVALGILLGCVVGAFLSGLWVAKRALENRPIAVETEAAADGADAGTVEFFGGPDGSGAADDPAPLGALPVPAEPSADSSRSAEAGSPGASEERTRPREPVITTPVRSRLAEAARADTTPPAAETAGSVRRPADEARTASQTPAASAAGAEVPAGSKVIQVFSSADSTQAGQLVERLRAAGYRAFVSPVEVGGRTMHRVRVGPFAEESEAEKEADEIKRAFKLDTWITGT